MEASARGQLLELVSKTVESPFSESSLDNFYETLERLGARQQVQADLADVFWLLWSKLDGSKEGSRKAGLVELIKACLRDKKLERRVAMEVFEPECMQAVDLVQSLQTNTGTTEGAERWRQKEVRYNTKALYTVNKFNLVREDSEGYAKLVVALNNFGDMALEPEQVDQLYKEIQSLIGYFDLDPNRVLDLVLDAAELQPYNKAYLQLVPKFKRDAVLQLLGFKFEQYQKPSTGPAPDNLFLVAASLIQEGLVGLGPLLKYLAPTDKQLQKSAEAAEDELKKEVGNIGVINLNAPTSNTADNAAANALTDRAGPGGGGGGPVRGALEGGTARAPMMMGGGSGIIAAMRAGHGGGGGQGYVPGGQGYGGGYDEGPGLSGGAFRAASQLRSDAMCLDPAQKYEALLLPKDSQHNQKLGLARALLQVGCYEAADVLMGHLSALGLQPAAWPPLSATLSHTVAEELAPILAKLVPNGAWAPGLLDAAQAVLGKLGAAGNSATLAAAMPTALKPGPALSHKAFKALMTLGPFLGRNPRLLTKVVQAVHHHYLFYCIGAPAPQPAQPPPAPSKKSDAAQSKDDAAQAHGAATHDEGDATKQKAPAPPPEVSKTPEQLEELKVVELLQYVLLPASSLVPCLPALSQELWSLLRLFPASQRYNMYAVWKEQVDAHPYLSAAAKMAVYETKKVLKRVTAAKEEKDLKEQCKPHGRMLAKIACANPITVLEVAVAQLEAYDNQLKPIAEAVRYLTPLGFDALTFVILSDLSAGKSKVGGDGTNVDKWLQHLAGFTGLVCKKYTDVDIFTICQYLANALRDRESYDLLVLSEMIDTLTGVKVAMQPSMEQLEAKMGGETLSECAAQEEDKKTVDLERAKKAWARGGKRLLEALQRGPPAQHLALPLFILVAQQRQAIMVHTDTRHNKFLSSLYDKCHETCLQYLEYLQAALPPEAYQSLIPSMRALARDYKLDPEVVFMAERPRLQALIQVLLKNLPPKPRPAEEGEIEGGGGSGGDGVLEEGQAPVDTDVVMEDAAGAAAAAAPVANGPGPVVNAGAAAQAFQVARVAWQERLQMVRDTAPQDRLMETISPNLYALFWSLTAKDIYCPDRMYELETERAEREFRITEDKLIAHRMNPNGYNSLPEEEVLECGNRRNYLKGVKEKLPAEHQAQQAHVNKVKDLLGFDKETLFPPRAKRTDACKALVTHCALPRLLCSPLDAVFCAKFPILLHELAVPHFSTVWYLNELISDITPALRCLTDHEASNMGIFLSETFRVINRWRSSDQVYKEECASRPGFNMSLATAQAEQQRTSYEMYKKLVAKWHKSTLATIKNCLETPEYTSRRNVLTILERMLPVFPVMDKSRDDLNKALEKASQTETREDLKVSLKAFAARLKMELDKPGRIIPADEFGDTGNTQKRKVRSTGAGTSAAGSGGGAAVGSPSKKQAVEKKTSTQTTTATAAGTSTAAADTRAGASGAVASAPAATSAGAAAGSSKPTTTTAGAARPGTAGPSAARPAATGTSTAAAKTAAPAQATGGSASKPAAAGAGAAGSSAASESAATRLRPEAPEFKLTAGLSNAGIAAASGAAGGSGAAAGGGGRSAEEPRASKRVKTEPAAQDKEAGPAEPAAAAKEREGGAAGVSGGSRSTGHKRDASASVAQGGSAGKRARVEGPSATAAGSKQEERGPVANGDHAADKDKERDKERGAGGSSRDAGAGADGPAAAAAPASSGSKERRKSHGEGRDKDGDGSRGKDKEGKEGGGREGKDTRDKDKERDREARSRERGGDREVKEREGHRERGEAEGARDRDHERESHRDAGGKEKDKEREREGKEGSRRGRGDKEEREGGGGKDGKAGERDSSRHKEREGRGDKGKEDSKTKEEPESSPAPGASQPRKERSHEPIQPPQPRQPQAAQQPKDTEGSGRGGRSRHSQEPSEPSPPPTGGGQAPRDLRQKLESLRAAQQGSDKDSGLKSKHSQDLGPSGGGGGGGGSRGSSRGHKRAH